MKRDYKISSRTDNLFSFIPIVFTLFDFLVQTLRHRTASLSIIGVGGILASFLYYLWIAFEEELQPIVRQKTVLRKKQDFARRHQLVFSIQFSDSSRIYDVPEDAYTALEVGDTVVVALTPFTKRIKSITINVPEQVISGRRRHHSQHQDRLFQKKVLKTVMLLAVMALLILYGLLTGKLK